MLAMDDRFNTPHTDMIQMEVLGHKLQLAQNPNSRHLGTTVWDASIVFVKFLEQNCKKGEFSSPKIRGKRVIELGSGCGLAGLGMALLGCHVVATDQIEVLPLLLRNVERNLRRAMHSPSEFPHIGPLGTIEVAELDWGNQQHIISVEPPFDYIVGTDILGYEFRSSAVHEKMMELWRKHFIIKVIPRAKLDLKYQHESIQIFTLKPKFYTTNCAVTPLKEEESSVEPKEVQLHGETVYCETPFSPGLAESKVNALASTSIEHLKSSEIGQNCETLQHHKVDLLTIEDPVNKIASSHASYGNSIDEWEIRRSGSMAARIFKM
eukprot:c26521_g1_i3 orf=415-1380(-)